MSSSSYINNSSNNKPSPIESGRGEAGGASHPWDGIVTASATTTTPPEDDEDDNDEDADNDHDQMVVDVGYGSYRPVENGMTRRVGTSQPAMVGSSIAASLNVARGEERLPTDSALSDTISQQSETTGSMPTIMNLPTDGGGDDSTGGGTLLRPASGTKRPLMTHTKDGKLLSEKKLRRLEKNRLSARECRRRKREATENLEREINVLEAENLRLRLQLQIGKEAEESRLREQEKLTQDIDELLKSGAAESDIHTTLEEFKEKHADYGKSRRSAIEFHLQNIERLLMPTQTTSLVMHAIQGGGAHEAYHGSSLAPDAHTMTEGAVLIPPNALGSAPPHQSPPTQGSKTPLKSAMGIDTTSPSNTFFDPKTLFQYLVTYLEVTPQQASALKDSRRVASELDGCLAQALSVTKELRDRLAQTGDDLEAEFNNVRSILTPTQAAKFLVWVANNRACMHLLNELWDRVYPSGDFPVKEDNDSPAT